MSMPAESKEWKRQPELSMPRARVARRCAQIAVLLSVGVLGAVVATRLHEQPHLLAAGVLESPVAAGPPLRAVVVAQARDCGSRLGFLRVFARPDLNAVALLQSVATIGGREAQEQAEVWLVEQGHRVPTVRLSASTQRTLESLGYQQTPLVLFFDRANRLRFAVPGPTEGEELVWLTRLMPMLLRPAEHDHQRL